MIKITLPDGSSKEVEENTTPLAIAQSISEGLARAVVAAKVNDKVVDLSTPLTSDCTLQLLKFDDKEGKEVFWHSSAHLLAMAVQELWPEIKLTIGPPIEEGFFYDFYKDTPFTPEDLEKIESKMKEWRDKKLPFVKSIVNYDEAKGKLKDNKFKLEILEEYKDSELSFYTNDPFTDLCRGPHVPHTGYLKAFKLTKISSAYWRGDAKKDSLQRIYGIAFPDKKLLKEYLHKIEEAQKRDHRKIGKELDLFSFNDISPGAPFFHPKGAIIYTELQAMLRARYRSWGYQEVITPLIYSKELWEQSGHWEHYKENMFEVEMDGKEASLKPMNCPSHILIYKTQSRSYQDLPLRITDFAPLHRNELKGTLGGLTRVRKFSQDDCHVFCTLDQIKQEIKSHIEHVRSIYEDVFGFDFNVEFSTKPEKAMGDPKDWEKAEKALKEALDENGVNYQINPGDGAFYGPKIDFHIKDSLGRSWQCATEQLDFQLPQRFNAEYEGSDNKKHPVVMLHRTVIGSLERFMGVLIEHFAGKFPLWLSPVQVRLLTIADRHEEFAKKTLEKLEAKGIRTEIDSHPLTMNKKIRNAQLQQVPYICVIGDKEVENDSVNVRTRDNEVHGEKKVDELISELTALIEAKKIC